MELNNCTIVSIQCRAALQIKFISFITDSFRDITTVMNALSGLEQTLEAFQVIRYKSIEKYEAHCYIL